jgi:hypothetical protein
MTATRSRMMTSIMAGCAHANARYSENFDMAYVSMQIVEGVQFPDKV